MAVPEDWDAADSHAGVRFPPPLIFVGTILIGLAADAWLGLNPAMPDAVRMSGAVLVLAAVATGIRAIVQFVQAGNAPEPWKPDTAFVATGLYRFSRNPMYLAMALAHLGFALWSDSLGPLLMLPVACLLIDRLVIAREERHLSRRFGRSYEEYRRHVRRWLWPRRPPGQGSPPRARDLAQPRTHRGASGASVARQGHRSGNRQRVR